MSEVLNKLKLLKQFKQFQREWTKKSPKQKWQVVFNFGAKSFELCGVRVYTDMKVHWYSYLLVLAALIYVIMVSYTIWFFFKQGEYFKGLECTYTVGIVTSVCISYFFDTDSCQITSEMIFQMITIYFKSIGSKRFAMNNLVNFGRKCLFCDDIRTPEYYTMCEGMVDDLVQKESILVFNVVFAHALLGIIPFYLIILKNIRVTVMGLEMPFFDAGSDIGYAVNLFVQSTFGLISIVTLIAVGTPFVFAYTNAKMVPEIIRLDLKDLQKEFRLNGMSLKAKVKLRNALMKVQDFNG